MEDLLMKSKLLKTLVSAMLVGTMVLSAVGCGGKETAEAPAATEETTEEAATEKAGKVAIIYTVTGKGDLSFNDGCCKGAMKAAEDFGIELVEVEPTSLSDTEQAFEEMSAEGDYDLIIGITYEALDPIIKIAPNYPDQKYAIIDTDAGQPNCVSYIAKENESAFLAGCLAALIQTETENPMDLITVERVMYATVKAPATDNKQLKAGVVREFSTPIPYSAVDSNSQFIIKDYNSLKIFAEAVKESTEEAPVTKNAVFVADVEVGIHCFFRIRFCAVVPQFPCVSPHIELCIGVVVHLCTRFFFVFIPSRSSLPVASDKNGITAMVFNCLPVL